VQFLRQAPPDRPFLLYFEVMAPHGATDPNGPPLPAPEDETLYAALPGLRPASFNEADASDKPAWLRAQPLLTASQINGIDNIRRVRLRTLMAVDRSIDGLLTLLQQQGRLDNTLVVFLSDNGFFLGEHRLNRLQGGGTLAGKDRVYEEGHLVPMVLRYPPLVPGARVDAAHLVANIDLAPTMYELAGVSPPYALDGRSLVPLLRQPATSWRDALLLESSLEIPQRYSAIRTSRYLYVETPGDSPELYDTRSDVDPYELRNAVRQPEYANVVASLKARLAQGR
jgi:N-acetylglucosamine-6-sulfatase